MGDKKEDWIRWYLKNPDYFRKYSARWRAENQEKYRESQALWKKVNPAAVAAQKQRRRANKLCAGGVHTVNDLRSIREAQNDLCGHCRYSLNGRGHLDHIIPITRGGSNWPSNLQWLCAKCNHSKGDIDPREFVRKSGVMFMCWAP